MFLQTDKREQIAPLIQYVVNVRLFTCCFGVVALLLQIVGLP